MKPRSHKQRHWEPRDSSQDASQGVTSSVTWNRDTRRVLEEPKHFHVAIKLTVFSRFLPFKMALRMRSGFATHWSTSHSQWWSAVRYGAFATERKPHVDVTPLVWTASGKSLSLFEESQEPFNAAALKKRREAAAQVAPGQPPSKMPRTDHHLK